MSIPTRIDDQSAKAPMPVSLSRGGLFVIPDSLTAKICIEVCLNGRPTSHPSVCLCYLLLLLFAFPGNKTETSTKLTIGILKSIIKTDKSDAEDLSKNSLHPTLS